MNHLQAYAQGALYSGQGICGVTSETLLLDERISEMKSVTQSGICVMQFLKWYNTRTTTNLSWRDKPQDW